MPATGRDHSRRRTTGRHQQSTDGRLPGWLRVLHALTLLAMLVSGFAICIAALVSWELGGLVVGVPLVLLS